MLVEKRAPIKLGIEKQPKIMHLAKSLTTEERIEHIQFYKGRWINFLWSYTYMWRLDPDLFMHHLSLSPGEKVVKQKLRKMHPHVTLLVKAKLQKFLDVGFKRPVDYVE